MGTASDIAVFALVWVMCAFIVLPFGIRSHHDTGEEMVPGQDHGAPVNFRPLRVVGITTALATVVFCLWYLNYVNGWLDASQIGFLGSPLDLDNLQAQ